MRFDGDIIITDPTYILRRLEDFDLTDNGKDLDVIGLTTFISRDTIYGDWSCTVFNSENNTVMGQFCADAGMVAVMLLDEVLNYNPDFNYHTEKEWTTTLIKDFHGEVDFQVVHKEGVYKEDTPWAKKGDKWKEDAVTVVGKGNINFVGMQTGL